MTSPAAGRSGDSRRTDAGFSLVALVASMTIMLVLMGAGLPSWKYVVQNEREQELYFRGDQIATAIERYQKQNGGTFPLTLEVLVKGKFLRKAYTDPMVKDGKWRFIKVGELMLPRPGSLEARAGGRSRTRPSPSPTPRSDQDTRFDQAAPFIGVASTSEKGSLRIMNGNERYDQWLFVAGRPRVLGPSGTGMSDGNAGVKQKPAPGHGQTK
jgi:type II secretory pathway pseudopilin PulG